MRTFVIRIRAWLTVLLFVASAIAPAMFSRTSAAEAETNPLLRAASEGDLSAVQREVAAGADVNKRDTRGWPALFHAVVNDHLSVVDFLLKNGAEVGIASTNGTTALHFAASNHVQVAKCLLQHHALVDARNFNGLTPLYVAALFGNYECAKLLIDAKADVNATGPTNKFKQVHNVLMAAGQTGKTNLVMLLLDSGADPNRRTPDGNTAFRQLAKYRQPVVLKTLIDRGADVNSQGSKGHTALIFAAYNGHIENVKLLIDSGADLDATAVESGNYTGARSIGGDFIFNAELFAEQQNHPEIMEIIAAARNAAAQTRK